MSRSNSKHYDVIIIGAGSIGTPAAFFLARNGIKSLVIDRSASEQTSHWRNPRYSFRSGENPPLFTKHQHFFHVEGDLRR